MTYSTCVCAHFNLYQHKYHFFFSTIHNYHHCYFIYIFLVLFCIYKIILCNVYESARKVFYLCCRLVINNNAIFNNGEQLWVYAWIWLSCVIVFIVFIYIWNSFGKQFIMVLFLSTGILFIWSIKMPFAKKDNGLLWNRFTFIHEDARAYINIDKYIYTVLECRTYANVCSHTRTE